MKKYLIGLALAATALASVAFAQSYPIALIPALGTGDYVGAFKNGAPSAQTQFAPAGGIAGIEQYSYQVPLTGFSITVPAYVWRVFLNPAGTLATGTFTMMANPGDGQRICLSSTQTQTAITINANTGQTISTIGLGATPTTALVANTRYCWFYNASLSAWIRDI
jgi:hypothetical protein